MKTKTLYFGEKLKNKQTYQKKKPSEVYFISSLKIILNHFKKHHPVA